MGKTALMSFNNSWYRPGRGKFAQLFWFFTNLLLFKSGIPLNGLKIIVLRVFGAEIGTGVVIKPHVNIKYPWRLKIGNNCWIGENVWIDNLADVSLGTNVCVSQGALLLTGNHNYKKSTFDLIIGSIIIEEGVWIGAKSIVCPGVSCYSHSVLSVGSVANKNLDAYGIYVGNPAIKTKTRVID